MTEAPPRSPDAEEIIEGLREDLLHFLNWNLETSSERRTSGSCDRCPSRENRVCVPGRPQSGTQERHAPSLFRGQGSVVRRAHRCSRRTLARWPRTLVPGPPSLHGRLLHPLSARRARYQSDADRHRFRHQGDARHHKLQLAHGAASASISAPSRSRGSSEASVLGGQGCARRVLTSRQVEALPQPAWSMSRQRWSSRSPPRAKRGRALGRGGGSGLGQDRVWRRMNRRSTCRGRDREYALAVFGAAPGRSSGPERRRHATRPRAPGRQRPAPSHDRALRGGTGAGVTEDHPAAHYGRFKPGSPTLRLIAGTGASPALGARRTTLPVRRS